MIMPRLLRTTLSSFLLAVAVTFSNAQEVIDGMAAVVNGDVITYSQVRELVGAREKALREMHTGEELVRKIKETRMEALNDLIDRQLILQEFKKSGFSIPEYVVDEHVKTIIREEFGGDRAAFQRTLAAQGYTLARFKEIERDKIIVQAMRQKNAQSTSVLPPGRIDEYYKKHKSEFTTEAQVKLRMIVIPKNSGDGPEAQKQLTKEIRTKVQGGAEFEKMAELYSEDSTRATGGDWGWVDRGTLNETLTEIAFGLDAGEVSDVFEFGDNYYLLYCEAKKNATVQPLSEVRDSIEKKLQQEARQEAQKRWLTSLRDKAYIKTY